MRSYVVLVAIFRHLRDPHSFPTRRSSDLEARSPSPLSVQSSVTCPCPGVATRPWGALGEPVSAPETTTSSTYQPSRVWVELLFIRNRTCTLGAPAKADRSSSIGR